MGYVLYRSGFGICACHSSLEKVKVWRSEMEKKTKSNCFIFKEVEE